MRYRLRQYNTLYSNKGERYKDLNQQQFELLDAYALNLKEGRVELPQIDKSQKEMEKEILKLRAQIEILQSKQPMVARMPVANTGDVNSKDDRVSGNDMRRLQEQIRSTLEPFVNDIRKLNETNLNNIIHNLQNLQGGQGAESMIPVGDQVPMGGFRPPIPLPVSHNDWSKIKEGYSYTYSSKIPVEMKDL